MVGIRDSRQMDYDSRDRAFLLQFEGDIDDVSKKLGLNDYQDPVSAMRVTGLFGILDALTNLGLTNSEIRDFYIQGHVEPYNDPYSFTKGIIDIVYGMPKDVIEKKYGMYFNDETIEKISHSSINTRMLLSFCYDKDDTYEFIPDKDDLYDSFAKNYRYDDYHTYTTEKKFQKIDGKLFRVIRFLVRQGYDFPELECLMNEQIKNIVFKQTNSEEIFILNKEFAREISDNLLSLVCFLKRNDYQFLNPEYMLDQQCDSINLINSSGKQIMLHRSNLESDVNKYTVILRNLSYQNFSIAEIINLCDKRVKIFSLEYIDSAGVEHSITIRRNILETLSPSLLKVIKRAYNQGFIFPDSDNLFDDKQELLKVNDFNGKEHLVIRGEFDSMLDIIIQCKQLNFSMNLDQLFNKSQSTVELLDKQGRKAIINRNIIMHMMTTFALLTQNGYSFNDYSNLFDEEQPYIVCYDEQKQERIVSRKQINKIIKLQALSDKEKANLTDNEKDLLSMLNNYSIRKKLFEWLPYTAKKWIPSSAIINKIPADKSYEYFYNNNHNRLKILKDEFKPRNYDEMEGIISLGYILGLFARKESTSEKAVKYIIDYFLKKGITADELHTTYGAIDLRRNYNKKFADFFMYHYAIDSGAFIEPDLGTNMVGELFDKFDEVCKNRPEKRIKTRTINKLLTPIDAMASIMNMKIDREMLGKKADDSRYIRLVELLTKFGASKEELKWAINLYEQALAIDEEKVNIPYIEDLNPSLMQFTSHLKSDPQAFLSGRKTNCCSRYGGFAQDRLTHVITDLDWRYVTFTSLNRTFFDGLVWYDKKQQVVCIDNVEGQFSKFDKNNDKAVAMMADTVIRYADGIYHKMNELNIPCIKVNVGKDPKTASWEIFNYAIQQRLINDDDNPCNYPFINGISTDANKQFTITDEKTLRIRRKD